MKNIKLCLLVTFYSISTYAQPPLINDYYIYNSSPDETSHIVGSQSYLNNTTEGDYSVWFGCGGNSLHTEITKPFIWVEGKQILNVEF